MAVIGVKTVIQTASSRLTVAEFTDRDLVNQCVEEVKNLLIHYPPIVIFGKPAHQRRDVGFFSDTSEGYRYSGQLAKSQPLTDSLKKLLVLVNTNYDAKFNGILINRYNHGKDYISPHSDDERYLDQAVGVVAISVGATRSFVVRGKIDTAFVTGIPLTDMSIVHMAGGFQKEFTHSIPPAAGDGVRYSLTFRCHKS